MKKGCLIGCGGALAAVFVIFLIGIFATVGDDTAKSPAETAASTAQSESSDQGSESPAPDKNTQNGSGSLGDYDVQIKGAKLAKDYDGNPAIIVTYSWKNNSSDTINAEVALMEKAFQNGIQLETAMILDSDVYDSDASFKDLRPGATLDVQAAFLLSNTTSIVEFELSEFISFSSKTVTMEFDPSKL